MDEIEEEVDFRPRRPLEGILYAFRGVRGDGDIEFRRSG